MFSVFGEGNELFIRAVGFRGRLEGGGGKEGRAEEEEKEEEIKGGPEKGRR